MNLFMNVFIYFTKCINISCRFASVTISGIRFPSVLESFNGPLVLFSSKSVFFNHVLKAILENCMINTHGSSIERIQQEGTVGTARKVGV